MGTFSNFNIFCLSFGDYHFICFFIIIMMFPIV